MLFNDLGHPNKMFPIAPSLVMVGRSVGRLGKKKKKQELILEEVWVPEKARLLSEKAWLQSQLENMVFSFVIRYMYIYINTTIKRLNSL